MAGMIKLVRKVADEENDDVDNRLPFLHLKHSNSTKTASCILTMRISTL